MRHRRRRLSFLRSDGKCVEPSPVSVTVRAAYRARWLEGVVDIVKQTRSSVRYPRPRKPAVLRASAVTGGGCGSIGSWKLIAGRVPAARGGPTKTARRRQLRMQCKCGLANWCGLRGCAGRAVEVNSPCDAGDDCPQPQEAARRWRLNCRDRSRRRSSGNGVVINRPEQGERG